MLNATRVPPHLTKQDKTPQQTTPPPRAKNIKNQAVVNEDLDQRTLLRK